MELSRIQKRENLNQVFSKDEIGPGGAHHSYLIMSNEADPVTEEPLFITELQFQKCARKENNSVQGVIDTDLLEIVRDRLKAFQTGPFANEYNEHALKHIEEALHCMNARIEDRIKRNVLGVHEK